MSLQGSFETIALRDVMSLLASSNKSGELRVVGGHVEGRLWIEDGRLVASKVGKAHDHVDAMFELLRLSEGNFVFKDGVESPPHEESTPVEPVVREAEERLKEWHDIVTVVPSLEHRVRLIPELPTPEVTLSAEEWRLVMAIALAATVLGALEEVGLSQFEGCRGIRRLVDAGLVIVDPPRVRPSASDPARAARRAAAANGSSAAIDDVGARPRVTRGPLAPTPVAPSSPQAAEPAGAGRASAPGSLASLAALAFSGGAVASAAPAVEVASPFEAALQDFPSTYDDQPEFGLVHDWPVTDDHEVPNESLPYAVGGDDNPAPAFALADRPEAEALHGRRARRQAAQHGEPMIPVLAAPVSPLAAGAADEQDRDPESINRGLLLKFLSSVRS